MNENFVFCIFCEVSKESKVEKHLKHLGYTVISALVERNIFRHNKITKEFRSLIPGYVFFENEHEPEWEEILKNKHIYYSLHYGDNDKRLKNEDLHFTRWLKGNNGRIKISKVKKVGNRIKIVEGPLMDLEGKVIKINKRQKCAGVKIEGEGIKNIIWLSYEIME